MKKVFFLLFLMPYIVFAQSEIRLNLTGVVSSNKINIIHEKTSIVQGQEVIIIGCHKRNSGGLTENPDFLISFNGDTGLIEYKDLKKLDLLPPTDISQQWQHVKIDYETYKSLLKEGYQYDLRRELEEESLDLIAEFNKANLFFADEYLEDYLQTLLYKIHPITLEDGRPGNLRVKILKNPNPNAFALPNGIVVVNTGLISLVNSEAELLGVLAHEVAHIVLDHQLININKQVERQQRAEFWADFATVLAAAGEIYLNVQSDIYTGGVITASTAVISHSIAQEAIVRFGLEYSQEQETEADLVAMRVLSQLGHEKNSLSNVLARLKNYSIINGDYFALSSKGTHPSLNFRITSMGQPADLDLYFPEFQKKISMVNSFNALNELYNYHLLSAEELVNRNIEAKVATEDDYIVKAIITRQLHDNQTNNEAALYLLECAEKLSVNPRIQVYKQKAITLIRLERYEESMAELSIYLDNLYQMELPCESGEIGILDQEIEWTRAMLHKLRYL